MNEFYVFDVLTITLFAKTLSDTLQTKLMNIQLKVNTQYIANGNNDMFVCYEFLLNKLGETFVQIQRRS